MMKSSRQIAFETLYKIFMMMLIQILHLTVQLLEIPEGKAFITRLVYGVVERKITIDSIISAFCKNLSQKVLVILRMGIYQLLFYGQGTGKCCDK